MDDEARRRELIRLVEAEIDGLRTLVTGVLSAGNTLRTAGIAVWSAAIGAAVVNDEPALASLAVVALLGFALVDAYHGHLYALALKALVDDESLLKRYYGAVGRDRADTRQLMHFDAALEGRTYSVYGRIERPQLVTRTGRKLSWRQALSGLAGIEALGRFIFRSRPGIVFAGLYPVLAIAGCVTFFILLF